MLLAEQYLRAKKSHRDLKARHQTELQESSAVLNEVTSKFRESLPAFYRHETSEANLLACAIAIWESHQPIFADPSES